MFSGWLHDFSRMFSGCSDWYCGPGGIWRSFQMKVWTLMIQRSSMIPAIQWSPAIRWSPAIWWSPAIRWSPVIRWSIGSMHFDNPKVYGDTSITDGLVLLFTFVNMILLVFVLFIYSHLSTWLSLYLSCSLSRLRMNAACHQSCPLLSPPRSPARAASQAHCRPTS